MLSKNTIKYLRSLQLKKFRQKYNNFVVEGDKIAQEIIRNPSIEIESIYALDSWIETNENALQFHLQKIIKISEKDLTRISGLKTPNQVLIVVKQLKPSIKPSEIYAGLSIYLDSIKDPGNFGTIIRTADWFGIKNIFCSLDCVELYNPKVLQATMGSFLRINVFFVEFDWIVDHFPNLEIYGAVLEGTNLFESKKEAPGMIVIGNESRGISEAVLKHLTHKISIPAFGKAESLNAAVACGIVLASFRGLAQNKADVY